MNISLLGVDETLEFGEQLGSLLEGGEVIELIGDVGAGKTTLVKGVARGLAIAEPVQSPTFTISRHYEARDDLELVHYDFYRLSDAGIMRDELAETLDKPGHIVALEWAALVEGVLPADRLTIQIDAPTEESRRLTVTAHGPKAHDLIGRLR